MKKHLLLLFAALLPLVINAHNFEVGGIYYNITSYSDLTVAVTYRGDGKNQYSNEYIGAVTIPSTVTYGSKTYNTDTYSVTSIAGWAFSGCSSLAAITLPEGVTRIGIGAFSGCSSLTTITIPEDSKLTSIGLSAFAGCSSLAAINIPEGVTSIGDDAFYKCSSLTSITLPEGVTSIGKSAFSKCSSLTTITLPEGVTSIGNWAFQNCSILTAITCHAVTPPAIDSNTFEGVDKGIPVYVPAGSVEAYKEAKYWDEFRNFIGVEAGIDKSQLTTGSEQQTIYDLCGHRVDNPVKGGIYIVGGKKMMVK